MQVLLLLIAAWSALVAHECGHIVAGLLLRFRFGILVVGPFWLVREGRRVRLRWRFVPAVSLAVALGAYTIARLASARNFHRAILMEKQ